jgi:hypothetical protein
MSLTKLSLAGIFEFFPARESLVSDIPAGDGKIDNLFFKEFDANFDAVENTARKFPQKKL